MCGIAGLVSTDGFDASVPARVTAMRDAIAHRGPDAVGFWRDDRAMLAHRRLSIVDLSAGQQPMSNEDGTIWVSFNGEIYNHAELRPELEAHGHRYRTRCDTEALVHAYEQWGDDCVQRFRGMFAFALWDARRQRLLLVRDRLGVKPLYWARAGNALLFGSEIKALLASNLIEPEVRRAAIPELLSTRALAGDATLFRGVHRVEPGHLMTFENGVVRTRRYWDMPVDGCDRDLRPEDVVPRFRALLEESVRLRLMSDVPLGVFLSGGIDSSAIAAIVARLAPGRVQTFSVAFKDRAFNELDHARTVANHIGAIGHETVIDDRDFFAALPKLVWHEDEPIAHPSSVPLFFVSALARQHAIVILTGEGSDELLAGYGRYPRMLWNWRAGGIYEQLVPRAVRKRLAAGLVPRLPRRVRRYADRSFLAMPRTPSAMFFDNFASVRLRDQQSILAPDVAAAGAHAYDALRAEFDRPPHTSSLLQRILYADVKTYLVELLMKQDQMSMAASVESRVPFLDHHLVEFAARLPDEWKLSGRTTKRVLREAMTGILPESILTRPKMGFPVPFGQWTRGAWHAVVRDVLLDRRTRERGIFQPDGVERLIAAHSAGRIDAGDRIWSLLNFELWYRTFIDREGVQSLPIAGSVASSTSSATRPQVPAAAAVGVET